jgi:hypothetical protein
VNVSAGFVASVTPFTCTVTKAACPSMARNMARTGRGGKRRGRMAAAPSLPPSGPHATAPHKSGTRPRVGSPRPP